MSKSWISVRIDDELLNQIPDGRGETARAIREALRFWMELKDKPRTGAIPTEAELAVMREQVKQTQAIGRNLNQLIREWYAIKEGKDSHIDAIEWENLHRLVTEVARDMQKIVQYWGRK